STDTYDKRASLAYFKRRQPQLSDSRSDISSLSAAAKRATLSYFKRDHFDHPRFNGLQYIKQIAEICPCLNREYLNGLMEHHNDEEDNLELEKRASLAYFK
ncbi:unnamed protein product, partial [Schistosoma turkestanicum]